MSSSLGSTAVIGLSLFSLAQGRASDDKRWLLNLYARTCFRGECTKINNGLRRAAVSPMVALTCNLHTMRADDTRFPRPDDEGVAEKSENKTLGPL